MKKRIAFFPGSFDPFTLGHKAVVNEGLKIFDEIVIGVGINSNKKSLLSDEQKVKLIKDIFDSEEYCDKVSVITYDVFTGDCCKDNGCKFILRGLRNTLDYEYERNIALLNEQLYPDIQTVLLFTPVHYTAISSSVIREMLRYGKDVTEFMPSYIDVKNYL